MSSVSRWQWWEVGGRGGRLEGITHSAFGARGPQSRPRTPLTPPSPLPPCPYLARIHGEGAARPRRGCRHVLRHRHRGLCGVRKLEGGEDGVDVVLIALGAALQSPRELVLRLGRLRGGEGGGVRGTWAPIHRIQNGCMQQPCGLGRGLSRRPRLDPPPPVDLRRRCCPPWSGSSPRPTPRGWDASSCACLCRHPSYWRLRVMVACRGVGEDEKISVTRRSRYFLPRGAFRL